MAVRQSRWAGSRLVGVGLTVAVAIAVGSVLGVAAGASDYREIKAELDHSTPR